MFDFENLKVYKKAKETNKEILGFLNSNNSIDPHLRDQLKRASTSIILNIAEGSGKLTVRSKRNFYTIARGSIYECVAILEIIYGEEKISRINFGLLYRQFEEISKMLLGLIKNTH